MLGSNLLEKYLMKICITFNLNEQDQNIYEFSHLPRGDEVTGISRSIGLQINFTAAQTAMQSNVLIFDSPPP